MFSTNAFALLTVAHPARMKCGTGMFSFQSKAVVSVANPGNYRHVIVGPGKNEWKTSFGCRTARFSALVHDMDHTSGTTAACGSNRTCGRERGRGTRVIVKVTG